VGAFILGTFLLLFGICFLLAGGGCTLIWLVSVVRGSSDSPLTFLGVLVSVGPPRSAGS
jgi:hypothetical protein